MTVASKIAIIAVVSGLLAVTIGVLSLVEIGSVADKAGAIYNGGLVPDQDVAKIRESVFRVRHASLSAATATTPEAADRFRTMTKQYEAAVDKYVNDYRRQPVSAQQKKLVETFYGHWTDYRELRDTADAQIAANKLAEWEKTRVSITKASDAALATLDKLSAASAAAAQKRLTDAEHTHQQSALLVAVIASIGLLVAMGLSALVARAIVRPLRSVRDVLNAVADGDLTQSAKINSRDELGEMGAALDKTVGTLHDVIQQIGVNATNLSRAARAGSEGEAAGAGVAGLRMMDRRAIDEELAEMADNLDAMINLFVTKPNTAYKL